MEDITNATQTTDEGTTIRRTEAHGTVRWVPESPGNRHYEEYLAWIAEGNTPEVIND